MQKKKKKGVWQNSWTAIKQDPPYREIERAGSDYVYTVDLLLGAIHFFQQMLYCAFKLSVVS